jgi:hypothetical protein
MIENLFCGSVRKRAEQLEIENRSLKAQLQQKQLHINETNKYWKKKIHDVKRKVKHVRLEIN